MSAYFYSLRFLARTIVKNQQPDPWKINPEPLLSRPQLFYLQVLLSNNMKQKRLILSINTQQIVLRFPISNSLLHMHR